MIRKPNRTQPWTVYVTPGELKPVKHFAINFGAPADMKDEQGTVWFSYPNPKTDSYTHFPGYGVKFSLNEQTLPGMGFFCRDFKGLTVSGTDKPWLFTSGCQGLVRCEIPLAGAGQEAASYTVRMGFCAMPGDQAGQRVFDVKLQDKLVLEGFDIAATAGAANTAVVKEFKGIEGGTTLVVELVPKSADPQAGQAPIINFIEVIKEETKAVAGMPASSVR
jgi:hypothetical protein